MPFLHAATQLRAHEVAWVARVHVHRVEAGWVRAAKGCSQAQAAQPPVVLQQLCVVVRLGQLLHTSIAQHKYKPQLLIRYDMCS